MSRSTGNILKLVESASSSNSKTKWNQVLNYLQGHTVRNDDAPTPPFDSPIPPYSCPSVELEDQLLDERKDTPLRVAVKSAPVYIIAALCHLGPEATGIPDKRNCLPLHIACRRSSEEDETNQILQLLIECNPESLLSRDDSGRTPLHWLLWYHAPTRSVSIVDFFCQSHPTEEVRALEQLAGKNLPRIPRPSKSREVPASAAIIPDARHGAIPLHYAVMQGTTREVMKFLISIYPASPSCRDRHGRTPLAWYLGAGSLIENANHISGEPSDPNATPWWEEKLSTSVIQLLLSSKVARTKDDMGRTPLHWASHFYALGSTSQLDDARISVKAFQLLLDNSIQALTVSDKAGQTPLHILFDVYLHHLNNEGKRHEANRSINDNVDLRKGGPVAFSPSKELIELLLKSPDGNAGYRPDEKKPLSASHVEDKAGRLPLHIALQVATSPELIQLLISSNPTSMLHTTEEELQTPLAQAFCLPYSAQFQPSEIFELLMAAYPTSRHGTTVDGRLALKMEDSVGNYPIHYAVRHEASLKTIQLFVEKYPYGALFQNAEGDLPIHSILSKKNLFDPPKNGMIRGASLAKEVGLLTEKEISWKKLVRDVQLEKIRVLLEPLLKPEHLKIANVTHGMTPLHIAVGFGAASYEKVYQMLEAYPEAAGLKTTVKGHEYSCMDLHEEQKINGDDNDEWYAIKELLFAFHPMVDSHRHDEDFLDACVKLVRDEVLGKGSYHSKRTKDLKKGLDISDTLSSIAAPEVKPEKPPATKTQKGSTSYKEKKKGPKSTLSSVQERFFGLTLSSSLSFGKDENKEKSIYDADPDTGYVVSPQNSDEDDDISFLSENQPGEMLSPHGNSTGPSRRFESQANAAPFSNITSRIHSSGNKKAELSGEKKRENPTEKVQRYQNTFDDSKKAPFLSDVALRIWCFFALFRDPQNANDNYVSQVEQILEDLDFDLIEKLVTMSVPECALDVLEEGTKAEGKTLHDLSSPCCMALFNSVYYFLGRYEFPTEKYKILLHQTSDKSTVWIRAIEHRPRTSEYVSGDELDPGAIEESIWKTGEIVEAKEGYVASKFSDLKRDVFFKLTRNQGAYYNEIACRDKIGSVSEIGYVLPLVSSHCAFGEKKEDKRYKLDSIDERFEILSLFGGEKICLSEYPYAFVYPLSTEGDLYDYFFHHGVDGMADVADISSQVGNSLRVMHEKGIVLGNVSMRNITMMPMSNDDETTGRHWAVSNLSSACRLESGISYMGGISHDGTAQFQTSLMPPETFVKLSAAEARIYRNYWKLVEQCYNITVDKQVVEPYINIESGSTYVLRCHYVPKNGESLDKKLPELPYQLVPNRESTDLWCFGLLLFALCSDGYPLFPDNLRTGHLLNFECIVNWDQQASISNVYEHVKDPLAQDILLQLLAPYEDRVSLTMETVLNHPFFKRSINKIPEKLINQRQHESAAYDRKRQLVVNEKSEDDWIKHRTTNVICWDFDCLRKIHFSGSEIVGRVVNKNSEALGMPCSFIVLPYKLSAKNKKSKLAPTTKKDVERAERMGLLHLSLSKSLFFAALASDAIESTEEKHWTASKLIEFMNIPNGADFEDIKEVLIKIAAENVEAFRTNPESVLYLLLLQHVKDIRNLFQDAGKAFLYLVDEYTGTPLTSADCAPYPLEIEHKNIDSLVRIVLPFMHASTLSVRGTSAGVSGVVRLIFEAAYPQVPLSWAKAAMGLPHVLDIDHFVKEVNILHKSLAAMSSSKENYIADDLRFVRETCLKFDTHGNFASMQRVECSGSSLWTTKEGAAEIKESCTLFGFREALALQVDLESQLIAQENEIKKLQEDVERLEFQKSLNLVVPEDRS